MAKTIFKLIGFILIFTLLILIVAPLFGKNSSANIVVTSTSLITGRTIQSRAYRPLFSYIDVDRAIIARMNPAVPPVQHVQLLWNGKAILMTRETEDDINYESILLYDLVELNAIPLFEHEGTTRRLYNLVNFGIPWFGDMEKILYRHPDDNLFYVLEIGTGETYPIMDTPAPIDSMTQPQWSRDGTEIAYKDSNNIIIVNSDGTNPRRFEQSSESFFFNWGPGDRLTVSNMGTMGGTSLIRLIDTQTGEIHPLVHDLTTRFISPSWYWCDDILEHDWIAYSHHNISDGKNDYLLVNLDTGEEVILSDHPMLQDVEIVSASWWDDCESLFLSGNVRGTTLSNQREARFYVMDRRGDNISFVGKGRLLGWDNQKQSIIYQTTAEEGDANKVNIYRQSLNTDAPAEYIGTHTLGDEWLRWLDNSFTRALYLPSQYATSINPTVKRGQLMVIDSVTGENYLISHPDAFISDFVSLMPR